MTFGNDNKTMIRDWKSDRDERMQIPRAIQTCCITYFMELGNRAGEQSLKKMGHLFRLNEALLTSLPSQEGNWMNLPEGHDFDRSQIALFSIGQGHASISPLHVNAITSAIASGSWHQPYLISEQKNTTSINLIGQGHITEASLMHVRKGFKLATQNPSIASRAKIDGTHIGGHTGTATSFKNYYGWFTGYAPFEKPKYSITVMLKDQNTPSKYAASIASKVFNLLLNKE